MTNGPYSFKNVSLWSLEFRYLYFVPRHCHPSVTPSHSVRFCGRCVFWAGKKRAKVVSLSTTLVKKKIVKKYFYLYFYFFTIRFLSLFE